jgi:hypothetical protein
VSRAAVFGLACLTALAGLLVGEHLERHGLAARLDAIAERLESRPPEAALHCTAAVDPELIRAELRRAMLVQAASPAAAPAVVEKPAVETPAADDDARARVKTPEAQAALDRGLRVLDAAKSQHSWGPQQRQDLRQLLGELDDESRAELLRQVSVAFNTGQMKLDVHGAPF